MCILCSLLSTFKAYADDLRIGLGGGVWDAGDSRFRPTVLVEMGWARYGLARYHSYGFTMGAVTQFGGATSVVREWNVSKDMFRLGGGFAHVWEKTKVTDDEKGTTQSATSQNFGLAFNASLVFEAKASFFALNWQNNCYFGGG